MSAPLVISDARGKRLEADVAYPLVPNVGIDFSGIDPAARTTIDEWVTGSLSV
jgi:hypothetical protein